MSVTTEFAGALLFCVVQFEELTYPKYETPLAEAYGGGYESVFILLHPFVAVPPELAWRATMQYPTDEQIAAVARKLRWGSVAAATGLRSSAKINQALLTSIGASSDYLRDDAARESLQAFLESESVWMPTEGRFEPLLHGDILDIFVDAGHEELIHIPEFPADGEVQRLSVAELSRGETAFPALGTLAAPDASFLFTVDWDSFFTLYYGPRNLVRETTASHDMEGFFAAPTTEHFWFNYSMGCATVTLSPDDWTTD